MGYVILVPVYNEAKTIGKTIKKLYQISRPFVIIDDGSTDNTHRNMRKYTRNYISYKTNKGKGYAVRYGHMIVLRHMKIDWVMVIDGDLQFNLGDIPQFELARKKYPDAKIIIGNRLHNPKNMPLIKQIGNRLMSWVISKLIGQKIPDTQCGFRLIHKDAFRMKYDCNRFDFESEMLVKAGKAGMKIVSVPIQCIYKKGRKSKVRFLPDLIRFIKLLIKLINN